MGQVHWRIFAPPPSPALAPSPNACAATVAGAFVRVWDRRVFSLLSACERRRMPCVRSSSASVSGTWLVGVLVGLGDTTDNSDSSSSESLTVLAFHLRPPSSSAASSASSTSTICRRPRFFQSSMDSPMNCCGMRCSGFASNHIRTEWWQQP